jgi:large conductance mechanosensitive channel
MLKEFKEFAMRGNVMDMAVGIVIGGAFGKIISSFVGDVLMPPIGMLLGGLDFSNLYVSLSGTTFDSLTKAKEAGAPTLNYGVFLNTVIDFLIVALAIFMVVKGMNRLKRQQEAPPPVPTTKDCPLCLSAIPIRATRCAHCTADVKGA